MTQLPQPPLPAETGGAVSDAPADTAPAAVPAMSFNEPVFILTLIWLAGKKDRYMHFGFQRAGNMLELDIEADNVRRHLTAHGNKTVFYPAPAQVPWHEVQKLTCPQRYRHDVPLEDYAFKCIDHQYLAAFALENGIPSAAIVFKPSERPELAEYGGKTEPLEDLLLAFSQKYPK